MKVMKLIPSNISSCSCCGTTSETVVIVPSSDDSIISQEGFRTKYEKPVEDQNYIDEMLCLCECINMKGYEVADEPGVKSITFEELRKVNIYDYQFCKLIYLLNSR